MSNQNIWERFKYRSFSLVVPSSVMPLFWMVGIDTVDGKITMPSSDKNGLKATVARTPPNGPKKKDMKVGKSR